jgi:acetyl-CoA carboxylase biotin carboxyl carrier protein
VDEPEDSDERPAIERVAAITRELAAVMRSAGLTRLDIRTGDIKIALRANRAPAGGVVQSQAAAPESAAAGSPARAAEFAHLVRAPMIGTFYLSPGPGEPPFVQAGDEVEAGQTIGIIEAMKIMNEIPADRAGIVEEILVANGQPVEYGSALMRLAPAGGG